MPKQSRRTGYGRKRMHKHGGGGWFDKISQKATQLKDDAVQKSKDMGLHDQVANAHQAAISHATTAKQMVSNASKQSMAKGMEVHAKMQPHLDLASSHANNALMHAQNKNMDGFKASMNNFASSMGNAGTTGGDHIMNNTKVGDATLADHASAMGSKVTSTASDLHGKAMSFLGIGANKPASAPVSAPYMGGRSSKSRKHVKKGHKSYTKKGHKYYNRKGGNPKKGQKSYTKKGRKDFTTKKGDKYYNKSGHRQSRNSMGMLGKHFKHVM